jgi:hypothetical protein
VAAETRLEVVIRRLGEPARERLDPWAERRHLLFAAPVQHREPARAAGELGRESCLADAAFAGDHDERALPGRGLIEQDREAFELLGPPDERRDGRLREPVRQAILEWDLAWRGAG